MFEKEAEESFMCKKVLYKWETDKRSYIDGFKDGYNKANEWHYVKDGDLPKENQLVMVYRVNPLGANIAITNWYDSYKDTKVIAWKEIVLPELKESR